MVRHFLRVLGRAEQGIHSRVISSPKNRSYSEAPYEHWVIICRASRGIAKNWRLCPALDAGFCILWALFSGCKLERVPVLRKGDASAEAGAPDGLRDNDL